MVRRDYGVALGCLLSIPVVAILGPRLAFGINPEIAAGHPHYVFFFSVLSGVKHAIFYGTAAIVVGLWGATCFFLARAKRRSPAWSLLGAIGPLGLAAIAALRNPAERPGITQRWFVVPLRLMCEVLFLAAVLEVSYDLIYLKHQAMVWWEAYVTGVSVADIVAVQDASSGMWAFGEGLEILFVAAFLFLLRPLLWRGARRLWRSRFGAQA